jgi:multisubunit Na+/H+ antiporter MnhF subunit
VNAFLIASTILLAALAPLLVVASLRRPIDGLVAVQAAGSVTTLALVCLSVGLGNSLYFTVAVVAAVASWIGALIFARFLGRWT